MVSRWTAQTSPRELDRQCESGHAGWRGVDDQSLPRIAAGPGDACYSVEVRDSGIGIEPAHRSRIFDPFFTTKDEGTGLGLAIVYSIVDAHQGRIDVESAIGQGTTCSIILPHPSIGENQNGSCD